MRISLSMRSTRLGAVNEKRSPQPLARRQGNNKGNNGIGFGNGGPNGNNPNAGGNGSLDPGVTVAGGEFNLGQPIRTVVEGGSADPTTGPNRPPPKQTTVVVVEDPPPAPTQSKPPPPVQTVVVPAPDEDDGNNGGSNGGGGGGSTGGGGTNNGGGGSSGGDSGSNTGGGGSSGGSSGGNTGGNTGGSTGGGSSGGSSGGSGGNNDSGNNDRAPVPATKVIKQVITTQPGGSVVTIPAGSGGGNIDDDDYSLDGGKGSGVGQQPGLSIVGPDMTATITQWKAGSTNSPDSSDPNVGSNGNGGGGNGNNSKGGLSGPALLGVVAVIAVLIGAIAGFFIWRHCQRKKRRRDGLQALGSANGSNNSLYSDKRSSRSTRSMSSHGGTPTFVSAYYESRRSSAYYSNGHRNSLMSMPYSLDSRLVPTGMEKHAALVAEKKNGAYSLQNDDALVADGMCADGMGAVKIVPEGPLGFVGIRDEDAGAGVADGFQVLISTPRTLLLCSNVAAVQYPQRTSSDLLARHAQPHALHWLSPSFSHLRSALK